MARLDDVASYIKSGNAGATMITFDIGFADEAAFDRILAGGRINREAIGKVLRLPPQDVAIFAYAPALIVKVTVPRNGSSGGITERDFDGVQQFAPLLDLEV